jgi:hypothetical protein
LEAKLARAVLDKGVGSPEFKLDYSLPGKELQSIVIVFRVSRFWLKAVLDEY